MKTNTRYLEANENLEQNHIHTVSVDDHSQELEKKLT